MKFLIYAAALLVFSTTLFGVVNESTVETADRLKIQQFQCSGSGTIVVDGKPADVSIGTDFVFAVDEADAFKQFLNRIKAVYVRNDGARKITSSSVESRQMTGQFSNKIFSKGTDTRIDSVYCMPSGF